jgi:hypothetical protein
MLYYKWSYVYFPMTNSPCSLQCKLYTQRNGIVPQLIDNGSATISLLGLSMRINQEFCITFRSFLLSHFTANMSKKYTNKSARFQDSNHMIKFENHAILEEKLTEIRWALDVLNPVGMITCDCIDRSHFQRKILIGRQNVILDSPVVNIDQSEWILEMV